jgi:hypothetical protein
VGVDTKVPKLAGVAATLLSVIAISGCSLLGSSADPAPAPATSGAPRPEPDYPGMPGGEVSGEVPKPKPRSSTPSTPAPNYPELTEQVDSGVFKVVATGCDEGSRVGSAFLVGDKTAATSYAVVAGAGVAALTMGSTTVGAKITAADPDRGVAILQLDRAVDGHVFDVADVVPKVGHRVGLLGVKARGRAVDLTTAAITQTETSDGVAGRTVSGLGRADTRIDPGLAGGPTLDASGRANGMALGSSGSGPLQVVSGTAISETINGRPEPEAGDCTAAYGPDVTMIGGSPPRRVQEVFAGYFGGINSGDYRKAYNRLGPGNRSERGYADYRDGWLSSYDFNIVVHSSSRRGAHVTFDSIFLAGSGPTTSMTCARWDIDYEFAEEDGKLLINKADPHRGGEEWREC